MSYDDVVSETSVLTGETVRNGLNAAILHIASKLFPTGFDVSDNAPETFDDLKEYVRRTGRMAVWSGNSDHTIFEDREVNYAFRAWHDHCHLRGHDFTPWGEYEALQEQWGDIVKLYGVTPKTLEWYAILEAEVVGQAVYHHYWGRFPANQAAHNRAWREDASKASFNPNF